jgi:hypothetical protein
MTTYQIQGATRRCARTGRELAAGEKFYSVLYDRGAAFVREDISTEAWQGPPGDAFSFWFGRVPPADQPKRVQIDDGLLLDCLDRLAAESSPQKINFRYVVALLLMRKKRLKFDSVAFENGQEYLVLRCPRTRQTYRVLNPQLSEQELGGVQEEVQKLLEL